MLIRHDLQLVFLHVPKCAGKELRRVLSHGCPESDLESLFNYSYCPVAERYVDLAHLPIADLRYQREYDWLNRYTTVACVRNPYARLRSAASEYHRQRSRADEQTANADCLSREQRWAYYRQLPGRHCQQDPRFIHSQPMHRFTHLGDQPMVDHLLRCETLLSDLLALAARLQWPEALVAEAQQSLRDTGAESFAWQPEELALAELLYQRDFELFSYPRLGARPDPADWPEGWPKLQEQLHPSNSQASELDLIHTAPLVQWHWGPEARRPQNSSHKATRSHD